MDQTELLRIAREENIDLLDDPEELDFIADLCDGLFDFDLETMQQRQREY